VTAISQTPDPEPPVATDPAVTPTADSLDELGALLSQLADLDDQAMRAANAADVDSLCEVSELLLSAHVRYAGLYRTFLARRLNPTRYPSGLDARGGFFHDYWYLPEGCSL
jgi:hypothetical protein